MNETLWRQVMSQTYGIGDGLLNLAEKVSGEVDRLCADYERRALANQARVMDAFYDVRLSSVDMTGTTGYGYGDQGREKTAEIFSRVFGGARALVSPHLLSGTHALSVCLSGLLRPNDAVLSLTGTPYDTLESVLGIRPTPGSLAEYGITYRQCVATEMDDQELGELLRPPVKLAYIQRSGGYSQRPALCIEEIEELIARVRELAPHVLVLVDNCYGEFVQTKEPGHVGAHLCAGSLIKNPGGGLAESGGYVVGDKDLVEQVAVRLSVPGQGGDVGSYLPGYRSFLQGLFVAPSVVAGALKGAAFMARFFEALGFPTLPRPYERRSDIIQGVELGSATALKAFCRGIQKASPVDALAHPEPWNMPGYQHQIIMAAGTFVQGASIELTADARFAAPFIVYLQGGLTYQHVQCAALIAAHELEAAGCLVRT